MHISHQNLSIMIDCKLRLCIQVQLSPTFLVFCYYLFMLACYVAGVKLRGKDKGKPLVPGGKGKK